MKSFRGKSVLITGASSGIGEALALEFARQGADLILAARRVDRLESVAGRIRALGRFARVQACDVTRDGDLEKVVSDVRAQGGKIDIVVANAGFGVAGRLVDLDLADYRRQFETNVFGVLRTIYATLEELRKNRGNLVLIGSVAGHVALPGGSAYSMSKFSVRALAEAIHSELAAEGVAVTLISPGFVVSEIRQVDNYGNHVSAEPDPLPTWLRMPTAQAARDIVRAVAAERSEEIITFHGKVAVWIQRHFPWIIRLAQKVGLRGRAEPEAQ